METSGCLRHQKIKRLTAQHTEKVADAAVSLWAQMATQIISIIGEGGFDSLYARSLYLNQAQFPWLAAVSTSETVGPGFTNLKINLEAQTPALASEANSLLLITFTDVLASLVGEPLTVRILDTAWNNNTQDTVGKE